MRFTSLLLALPCLAQGGAQTGSEPSAPTDATQAAPLLDHKRLSLAMQRLASEHTDTVSVLNVGHSRGGRMFEALRIAKGEIGAGRPAILVVANLDAPLVYTSAVALELARKLAEGAATDPRIATMLERTTVYVIPRANPDGAEARFTRPMAEVRATGHGIDDDRDGRDGEDPPSDVNGDGVIAWMKIAHPEGTWIEDPTDARVLIPADKKKGERGQYKLVREGRDNDKDEEASEDAPANAVVNRNFPQDWREHDPEAGVFATDEPEARALCEFVLSKKDIQLVVVLGELDVLVEKPKSAPAERERGGGRALSSSTLLEPDATLLEEIARRWKKICAQPAKGSTNFAGSFQAWCYAQRGILTVSVNPWTIPIEEEKKGGRGKKDGAPEAAGEGAADASGAEAPPPGGAPAEGAQAADAAEAGGEKKDAPDDDAPKPSDDAKRLAWIDAHPDGDLVRYLPWTPFQHPELGAIEIGGFAPYGTIDPPAARRGELAGETLELLVAMEGMLARVALSEASIQEIAPGLVEVRAVLVNESYFPLLTAAARRAESIRGAKVELFLPKDATIVAGPRQQVIEDLEGAGGRHELRWLVQGATIHTIGVGVSTDHAGTARYQEAR